MIDLPDDASTGPVEVRISVPVATSQSKAADEPVNPALEAARAKLRAAGHLVEFPPIEDLDVLSDEELFKLTDGLTGGPSVDEIMKDVRGKW